MPDLWVKAKSIVINKRYSQTKAIIVNLKVQLLKFLPFTYKIQSAAIEKLPLKQIN